MSGLAAPANTPFCLHVYCTYQGPHACNHSSSTLKRAPCDLCSQMVVRAQTVMLNTNNPPINASAIVSYFCLSPSLSVLASLSLPQLPNQPINPPLMGSS